MYCTTIYSSEGNEKVYLFGAYQKGLTNRLASGKLRDSIGAVVEDNKQGIQVIKITALEIKAQK